MTTKKTALPAASATGSLSIVISNPDGSTTTVTGTLADATVATTTPVVVGPVEPTLPANKINIDNAPSWKNEWDNTTPGSASTVTGSSSFPSTTGGRRFTMNSAVRGGGVRFSCHAMNSGCTAKRFVYEVTAQFNWTKATRWELDINLVPDATRVFMLCAQMEAASPNGNGYWDLTSSNPKGWYKSSAPAPLSSWKDGELHTVRVHASVDWKTGIVTYTGVSVDGVYTEFTGNNVTESTRNLSWGPVGLLLPNFQFEMLAGTLTGTASINIYHD